MAARDSNAGWAGEYAVSIGIGCAARTPRDVGSEWTEVGRRATGCRFGVPAGRGGSQMALAPHFRTTGFEPGARLSTGFLAEGTGTSTSRVIDADAPQPAASL